MYTLAQSPTIVKDKWAEGSKSTDQSLFETQSSTAFAPQSRRVKPDCLVDHHAPKSVRMLWQLWVKQADLASNGIIVINRQRQPYSVATVDRAIKWCKSHHLLFLTEHGGGRGNGNRYWVKWSPAYGSVSARQKAVNHPEHAKTLSFSTFAREGAFKLLEEERKRNKRSLLCKTSCQNVRVSKSKKTIFASQNKQQRRLRNERATRWAMARAREVTADKGALTAFAMAIRRALASNRVFIGPELARFTAEVVSWVRDHEEGGWEDGPQATFAYIGYAAKEARSFVRWERSKLADRLERKQEREEAAADPIADFSCRAFNGVAKATPPVMKRAISERSHKRDEHPATVYASDPVNVCDMMSGYLEKLKGGSDEVDRDDERNQAR